MTSHSDMVQAKGAIVFSVSYTGSNKAGLWANCRKKLVWSKIVQENCVLISIPTG